MPTYCYMCVHCGHEFEKEHGINEPGPTECPKCKKKRKIKRLIVSSGGFVLKGEGWARDGYR